MIKTEAAYRKAISKLKEDLAFIQQEKDRFQALGLNDEQIERAIEPQIAFHEQMKEEVAYYERIKRGEFAPIWNLSEIGRTLIAYRIYIGLSQQELAARLNISETQVSRDERNEYYGATTERIQAVMQAMGMRVVSKVELAPLGT
ncbi:helix-turn-helix domain-containing protein [Saccharibacillus sacchari]|uniref:helix-turn-helix domain-containing protein n=1 Tax=Saccharibacillus sacchari TaxID=456493 RepID=UPI0004B5BD5E|nr:helix-turn-helix transcriptional regulator [Saccharibacillus sacchari]